MASFKSANNTGIGVTPTAIYTVPASNTSVIIGLDVANILSSAITCCVTVTKGATTTFYVKDAPIPSGSTLQLISGQKVVLQQNDIVKVYSNTAASIDVIISYLEGV